VIVPADTKEKSESVMKLVRRYLGSVIERVPIPVAGVALGLAALGNLLQPFSSGIRAVLGLCSLFLILLLTLKVVMYTDMVRKDFNDPILASVSATYCMALMQLAGYLAGIWFIPALVLWIFAIGAHGVLIVWFTLRYICRFKLEDVFPTYFICYVGIIVASITSPLFDAQFLGQIVFWFGFVCYMVMLLMVTARYIKIPTPESARPLFCIYTAPMSLSLAGYLSVYQEPSLSFAGVLMVLAQLLFVIVLTRLPGLLRLPFYPSYAAMTFPFVITAIAFSKVLTAFSAVYDIAPCWYALAAIEAGIATVLVLYVFLRYICQLFGLPVSSTDAMQREESAPPA
jgi:exfoliative toxin A/B